MPVHNLPQTSPQMQNPVRKSKSVRTSMLMWVCLVMSMVGSSLVELRSSEDGRLGVRLHLIRRQHHLKVSDHTHWGSLCLAYMRSNLELLNAKYNGDVASSNGF